MTGSSADPDRATSSWTVAAGSDGHRIVSVTGQLDLAAEYEFTRAVTGVLGDGARTVAIDLGDVTFIDSSGVRALLQLHREHGEAVTVAAASDDVRRVLAMAGVIDLLAPGLDPC